jgi:predicted double-glycine peptidase
MRTITRWSEGGNSLYRTASITRTRTPVHLDLIDRWLAWGHAPMDWLTNWLQARNLVGASRWFAWPCEAYTQAWHKVLAEHQDTHDVEIDFERLSPDYREWLARHDAWLDRPDAGVGDEPRYRP